MLRELDRIHADGHITDAEHADARAAHLAAPWSTTIGYELEVFPSAAPDIPRGKELHDNPYSINGSPVAPYGYVVGDDAYYELSSPHSRHPYALEVATRGLVRAGFLPDDSDGWVGAHVSIGHPILYPTRLQDSFIRMLRMVELSGGTNAMRLSAPIRQAEAKSRLFSNCSWAVKGSLGVYALGQPEFPGRKQDSKTTCKSRFELRSLAYDNPDQFGITLDLIYMLSRGVLAGKHTKAYSIWRDIEEWMLFESDLPDHSSKRVWARASSQNNGFASYLMPYVELLESGDNAPVAHRVLEAAKSIAQAVGLDQLACYDKPQTDADITV